MKLNIVFKKDISVRRKICPVLLFLDYNNFRYWVTLKLADIFWSPEAMHYYFFLPTFIIQWKAKFQSNIIKNYVVISSPPEFTDPLKSIQRSQVKEGWLNPSLPIGHCICPPDFTVKTCIYIQSELFINNSHNKRLAIISPNTVILFVFYNRDTLCFTLRQQMDLFVIVGYV